MYHRSSSSAHLGGNITSPSGRTSWSTAVVATRVWVAWGIVAHGEVAVDVHPALELGELLMEAICLHMVFNPLEGFIFLFDFGDDHPSIDFELSATLVVAAVSFHFGEGGGVLETMGRFSQGVVGPSLGLE